MKRSTPAAVLLLFSAVAASAQESGAPSPAAPEPKAVVSAGDAATVRLRRERTPRADGDGFTITVTATNAGTGPVTVASIDVLGGERVGDAVPVRRLRALTFDGTRSMLTPLSQSVAGPRFIAVADSSRRAVVVGAFLGDRAADTTVSATPQPDGTVVLSATVNFRGGLELAPGAAITTPALALIEGGDAWFDLASALGENAPETGDVAGRVAILHEHGESIVARADGSPALNPAGRPLDAFASATPAVWHLDPRPADVARGSESVVLTNRSPEITFAGLWFNDVGIAPDRLVDVTVADAGGVRPLGKFARGLLLPLVGGETRALTLSDAGAAPACGFRALLVEVTDPEAPGVVREVDLADPALVPRIAALRRVGGALLLNHAGTDVLAPPPPLWFALGVPRVFPYRAHGKPRLPKGVESRFATRASNVEYRIGWKPQPLESSAWLMADDAGYRATPLQAVLVDGLPAARGFLANDESLLIIAALDLDDAEFHRLADSFRESKPRLDAITESALARAAVREVKEPSGLFRELRLPRLRKDDFAPAEPRSANEFTMIVNGEAQPASRELIAETGERVREDVCQFGGRVDFVIDLPQPLADTIAVVVRRAPTPAPTSYRLVLNGVTLGTVTPRGEDPSRWQEDVFLIPATAFESQWRAQLSLATDGGTLAFARAAFFRVRPLVGERLAALPLAAGNAVVDRAANGGRLRVGGAAYLNGLGLASGGAVEFDLEGRFASINGFVGIDSTAPDGSRAALRVLVDGAERARIDDLAAGKPATALRVDVRGGRRVRIEVDAAPDGATAVAVDVCDPIASSD